MVNNTQSNVVVIISMTLTGNGFSLLGAIGVVCLIVAIVMVVVGIYIKNRGRYT